VSVWVSWLGHTVWIRIFSIGRTWISHIAFTFNGGLASLHILQGILCLKGPDPSLSKLEALASLVLFGPDLEAVSHFGGGPNCGSTVPRSVLLCPSFPCSMSNTEGPYDSWRWRGSTAGPGWNRSSFVVDRDVRQRASLHCKSCCTEFRLSLKDMSKATTREGL
jgi:hypothetical protein